MVDKFRLNAASEIEPDFAEIVCGDKLSFCLKQASLRVVLGGYDDALNFLG